jgi:hypothetical protein
MGGAFPHANAPAPLASLIIGGGPEAPAPLLIAVQDATARPSYPEGNFRGNQLLDGSMSLSPLCPGPESDLHVSTPSGLHQSFPWLRPAQA